jgi:predicted ATP-binding protein involved in virulence
MKLEYLKLTNFRGFREFEITFDPSFTVLLGGNMAGKTTVLDGAAIGLAALVGASSGAPARDIEDDEVRRHIEDVAGVPDLQRQWPAIVRVRATFPTGPLSWTRIRDEGGAGIGADSNVVMPLDALPRTEIPLPVIAQYGMRRTWGGYKDIVDHRDVGSRTDGYKACFGITSTHGQLAGWMRKQTLVQLQRGGGYVQPQLAAVETAIKACINDVTRFWFDVQYEELCLERTGGDIQSFAMLSEGYRNTVAMVADIAWRAAVLNPQHGPQAHQLTEGVVLIDEIDLHLHPAWQRRIVGDLLRTFPKIQFIVTTHSPQIVASVKRDQVRLLDRNQLLSGKPYVEGRDSSEILEDVFGVPARPEEVKIEIKAVYQLIEAAKFTEARARLDNLEERLGPHDAELVRVRWLLDTENGDPAASSATST